MSMLRNLSFLDFAGNKLEVRFSGFSCSMPAKGRPKPFLQCTTMDYGADIHDISLTRVQARKLAKYILKQLEKK